MSISIYSVEKTPTWIHDKGVLEIIFCLKGSVRFSYAYEEFILNEGEYISVDRDAYYLYGGKDNLCVSFCIDLLRYEEKYPFIRSSLFICEGLAETTTRYPTKAHERLKGMMIAVLKYIAEGGQEYIVSRVTENIVELFIRYFDIYLFHMKVETLDEETFVRSKEISDYLHSHLKEKVTVGDLAKKLNLTEGYTSEYLRKLSLGFRSLIAYIRANESERYLLKTGLTIAEISEECGFSDVKYYYSAFKRWYKCTPKQFRDRYGNSLDERIKYRGLSDIKGVLDDILVEHYMELFL